MSGIFAGRGNGGQNGSFAKTVTDCNIDILGFTEPNTCWDLLLEPKRPAKHM